MMGLVLAVHLFSYIFSDFLMFFQFLSIKDVLILYIDRFDLSKLKRFNYFTLTLIKIIKLNLYKF